MHFDPLTRAGTYRRIIHLLSAQTTTFTSTNSKTAGGRATITLTLPSSGANYLVIDSVCDGSLLTTTTQTQRWLDNNIGNNACGNSCRAAVGGTTSLKWTDDSSDISSIVGASFKALASSTATLDAVASSSNASFATTVSYLVAVGSNPNRARAVFANLGDACDQAQPVISGVPELRLRRPHRTCGRLGRLHRHLLRSLVLAGRNPAGGRN